MSDAALQEPATTRSRLVRFGRAFAFGFGYWLAYVLVLEPGNLVNAGPHGLAFGREVLRMTGAGVLGGLATPVALDLARRFPIEGREAGRNAAVLLATVLGMASVLIVAGWSLAAWGLGGDPRPAAVAIAQELAGNGPPLAVALGVLVGIGQVVRKVREAGAPQNGQPNAPPWTRQVWVKTRSGRELIDLDRVDWIETQGNYLALRTGAGTHLIRETSARFEAGLDPERFVRIHRRFIVALDRICAVSPLGGGDAELRLTDGAKLRLSRSYRETLEARLKR